VLLAKLTVGLVSAALSAWALQSRALAELPERRFRTFLWSALVPGYLLAAWAAHAFRGSADLSDASGYYFPEALDALRGKLVYRDFESSYAPLFAYLAATCIALWRDPRVFVLAAVAFHALTLRLWLAAVEERIPAETSRRAAVLFAVSGHAFVNVAVGQNQAWLAALVALAAWLSARGRAFASGAALGAGLSAVKLLALVFVPPLWSSATRRGRWLGGFLAVVVSVYGAFALAGADVRTPVRLEGPLTTSGNLPFLVSLFGLDPAGAVGRALTAVGVAFAGAITWRALRAPAEPVERVIANCALLLLVMMLFSRKAYATYLVLALFPLCYVAVAAPGRAARLAYLALAALAPIEPSLWFRWFARADLRALAAGASDADLSVPRAAAWLAVELALVASYAVLALRASALARQETAPSAAPDRTPDEGSLSG
jgi:hypothetical protein